MFVRRTALRWGSGLRYSLGAGFSATNTVNAGEVIAQLWNPSSSVPLYVVRITLTATVLAGDVQLRRSSAKGTTGTFITGAAGDSFDARIASPSLAELAVASGITAEPTLIAGSMPLATLGTIAGSEVDVSFEHQPITVPPGEGLCLVQKGTGGTMSRMASFTWDE